MRGKWKEIEGRTCSLKPMHERREVKILQAFNADNFLCNFFRSLNRCQLLDFLLRPSTTSPLNQQVNTRMVHLLPLLQPYSVTTNHS